jgi:hypothetical protein
VRRLKKGSGKYKGKFPFKCFNCGKIDHFASKCPHEKKDQNSEGEEKYKSKRFGKKKSLCVNNNDSSGDTDSDSSSEDKVNEFMLMPKRIMIIKSQEVMLMMKKLWLTWKEN